MQFSIRLDERYASSSEVSLRKLQIQDEIQDTVKSRTGPRNKGLSWKIQDGWSPYRRGSGMVPFETALVSSYRHSIVTFHLSLRVSEILLLLCSSTPFSPLTSTVSSPPNFPMFPFWAAKSEDVGLIVRAVSFQDFQPMWS